MKLVLAIINDEDAYEVMDLLNDAKFSVTKLATTGGFLRAGNTTLICGTDESNIPQLLGIIENNCKSRKQIVAGSTIHTGSNDNYFPMTSEVLVGGATVFVLDVDQFKKF